MRPPVLPASVRRAVDEWLSQGYAVEIAADGSLKITPAKAADDLDLIDFRRKRK